MTLFQAESLIERGSTAVPQALQTGNFYGKYDLQHQPRSPYPAGQAILAVPYVWFARDVIGRLPGVVLDRTTLFYLEGFGATLSSATFAAGAISVFFLLLRRVDVNVRDSIILTALVAFGTFLFPYSGYFFSEPLSTLLFLLAAYTLFAVDAAVTYSRGILAGIILGFSVWVRPTMVLAAGMFALALYAREQSKRWNLAACVLLLPAISAIGSLGWNKHLFGRALEFGYPETAELGKHLNSFQTPFYVGLTGLLLSPGKSVFLYCPLLVVAIYGLRKLWHVDRGIAMLSAGLPLLHLVFYMTYTQWEGGYCPGPRYLLPSAIVCCLGLAPIMQSGSKALRRTVFTLAIIGFAVQLITYSTSFLEDQVNGRGYYDAHFDYRLSYAPLVTQTERLLAYAGGRPAPLGLGFDRWFVFLSKLGISSGTLVLIAIPPLVLAIWSFWVLRRAWIDADQTSSEAGILRHASSGS